MKNLSKNLLTITCKDYFIIVAEIVASMKQLLSKRLFHYCCKNCCKHEIKTEKKDILFNFYFNID